ncbi:hypothetical protein QE152_g4383 [Popillia japonica]|uniref:Uncharacterized protein n=1 Tax=Popillia japonica TaxID=7064 RepID=A0AAW1N0R9_POPJA
MFEINQFVLKHCVTSKPKRPGIKIKENVRNKPNAISVKYNIKTSKGTIPVWKKTFVAILGIGKNRLERIVSRYHQTGGLPAENRGGDQISHKTAAKRQAIKNFIEGFNCWDTHYALVGHSFLPPYRVFGQIERKIKKCATIINPEMYVKIIKEYATVLRMGEDYPIFDWKMYVKIIKEYATVLRMGEDYPIFDWKSEVKKVLKSPGS